MFNLFSYRLAVHREGEICVRIRLIFQSEMPPFLYQRPEAVLHHYVLEQHTVCVLFLGYISICRVAQISEEIKSASHVQLFICLHVKQCQVNRASAAMSGFLGNEAQREDVFFLQFRITIFPLYFCHLKNLY